MRDRVGQERQTQAHVWDVVPGGRSIRREVAEGAAGGSSLDCCSRANANAKNSASTCASKNLCVSLREPKPFGFRVSIRQVASILLGVVGLVLGSQLGWFRVSQSLGRIHKRFTWDLTNPKCCRDAQVRFARTRPKRRRDKR